MKREGASYFVTFRLADSLPRAVLERLQYEHASAFPHSSAGETPKARLAARQEWQRRIDEYLDRGKGACFLRQPEVADIVAKSLRYGHEVDYLLDDWVIMPNHVHVILWPTPNTTLSEILHSLKRYTARQANQLLGRTGTPFWQRESYDHWIRDDEEKSAIRNYIRMNPVNARLCRSPEEWPWGSAWRGEPMANEDPASAI